MAAQEEPSSSQQQQQAEPKSPKKKEDCPWCLYMKGGPCREAFEVRQMLRWGGLQSGAAGAACLPWPPPWERGAA